MSDFSIEMMAEKIVDPRTKEYFQVYRSYVGGIYRAALVSLWTVIICDLVFKLQELSDLGDETAFSILEEIKAMQQANPTSPEWEKKLLEEINERTNFLERFEYDCLLYLQKRRHICAHPVLTRGEILFTPTKEEVRSHIRNALEAVLTKPAIMTRKVFNALIEELEAKKDILLDKETLKRFLSAKYFPHFIEPVENRIFESLWRLVFKVTDDRCERNRDINFLTLTILFERRPDAIRNYIENRRDYFSEISFERGIPEYLFSFLREHPQIFSLLNDAARAQIENFANSDINYFVQAHFLSSNFEEHLYRIFVKVDELPDVNIIFDVYEWLVNSAKKLGFLNKALELGIILYGRSESYDIANDRFSTFIEPYLKYYNEDLLIKLMEVINNNDQTYRRRRAPLDHNLIVKQIKKVFNTNNPQDNPILGRERFPMFWMYLE